MCKDLDISAYLVVGPDDTEEIAEKLWSKISKLRIFED